MQHRVHGREHDVWWNLYRQKRFSHLLHFEFMVHHIMSDAFPFCQKTFLAFTALRIHGTDHDVYWISFSSKNVFHILCMVQHMMSCHFFYKKHFSHFPQASAHDFSSSVGIFNSPILSENLIWKYQTCENIHCYHHSCPNITAAPAAHAQYPRVGRACAVAARRPRMCSNGAPATPTLARVLGTYWDEFSRELGRIP